MKSNKKILALCSGGFDSVVMLHSIRDTNPDAQIHILFFNYGQKTVDRERDCSQRLAFKLHLIYHEVNLPPFYWSRSSFYEPQFSGEGEYLEMRNLVFISYAMSFCESLQLDYLYMATLKCHGYYDTSEEFLSKIGGICKDKGVTLCTPFSALEKVDLSALAFFFNIQRHDFCTCDNPINGEPCGECPDCLAINDIFSYVDINAPAKAWVKTFDPENEVFQKLFHQSPITEMRVLVNNDCQLKCKHCYYGFESMKRDRLTLEEFKRVFEESTAMGINNYHFSGKEPLYDDFMFKVADVLREVNPKADCTVVTNGIKIPAYASLLKSKGFSKVFLSVDDVCGASLIRSVTNVTDAALRALKEVDIPVEVFIDLHENNFDKVHHIVDFLYKKYGVKDFYARTIVLIGSANGFTPLNNEQLNVSYQLLRSAAKENKDITIGMTLSCEYAYSLLNEESPSPLSSAANEVAAFASREITPNFSLYPEFYCGKYENQITLTPDGFIHGCASEVSLEDYDKVSPGNVREHSLSSLVQSGKDLAVQCNCKEVDPVTGKLKFFSCTCCNAIDES